MLLMCVLKHLCSSLLCHGGVSVSHTVCHDIPPSPHALSVALAAWSVESVSKCRGCLEEARVQGVRRAAGQC